jgi:hypothetical protein
MAPTQWRSNDGRNFEVARNALLRFTEDTVIPYANNCLGLPAVHIPRPGLMIGGLAPCSSASPVVAAAAVVDQRQLIRGLSM